MSTNKTGLFGKLPAHGDFIFRDLSSHFINVWDEWLQGFVGSSREQLGENWLNVYLTSPIWRFALSEGVIDTNSWAGIMLPSVDRVGRYFPFTIVTQLPPKSNPTDFICNRPNWFQAMEDAALRALDGQLHIDDLVEELNDSNPMRKDLYDQGPPLHDVSNMVIKASNAEQPISAVLPFMMDAYLASSLKSYSVWSTRGSELIQPCLFTTKGLPPLSGISAMMDGYWSHWNWQEPFVLKT
ncbi:hypothetical protein TDB9533_03509 [Thalassocella blandensis]|nr:hypothetical protein TDB9533_03509 [Thalassocella blandensis]